jgi:hypothetical protein
MIEGQIGWRHSAIVCVGHIIVNFWTFWWRSFVTFCHCDTCDTYVTSQWDECQRQRGPGGNTYCVSFASLSNLSTSCTSTYPSLVAVSPICTMLCRRSHERDLDNLTLCFSDIIKQRRLGKEGLVGVVSLFSFSLSSCNWYCFHNTSEDTLLYLLSLYRVSLSGAIMNSTNGETRRWR